MNGKQSFYVYLRKCSYVMYKCVEKGTERDFLFTSIAHLLIFEQLYSFGYLDFCPCFVSRIVPRTRPEISSLWSTNCYDSHCSKKRQIYFSVIYLVLLHSGIK